MKRRGHPVLGAFAGFFFGLFLGLTLLVFTVVRLDSILLVILPVAFLLLGILWGLWAPLGAKAPPTAPAPMAPQPPPQPQ